AWTLPWERTILEGKMQRNTLIFRLTVLAGAIVVAAVLLTGLMMSYVSAPATQEAQLLPPEEVGARLADAGREVESLQREGGLYQVRLADGQQLWSEAASGGGVTGSA